MLTTLVGKYDIDVTVLDNREQPSCPYCTYIARRIKKKAAGEIRRHFSSLPFHYVKFPGACLSRSNLVLFGFLLSLLRDIQSGFARPVIFEDDAGIHNDDAFALRID